MTESSGEAEPRRSSRVRSQPDRLVYQNLGGANHAAMAVASHPEVASVVSLDPEWVPRTVKQARSCSESDEYMEALQSELDSLEENRVMEVVPAPTDKHVLGCMPIFSKKYNQFGEVDRYKCRIVALGNKQIPGLEYHDTYAPVIDKASVRIFLTMSAALGLKITQFDVKTAFLYGQLDEEVYMRLPPGYRDDLKGTHVARLLKAIYGLKQAMQVWVATFSDAVQQFGYRPMPSSPCLFVKKKGDNISLVSIYVDDGGVATADEKERQQLMGFLCKRFQMKNLGVMKYFIGMEIHQGEVPRTIQLHQKGYIEKMLLQYGMQDCKPVSTPMVQSDSIYMKGNDQELGVQDRALYRSMIGSVMYLMTCCRPDIAASVGILSRHVECPGKEHMVAAKRLLRYLQGTKDLGLTLGGDLTSMQIYCDSDWAADTRDRKSTTGYLIRLGAGLISWKSCKQQSVSVSSTEAEYKALAKCLQELMWLRQLFDQMELGVRLPCPVVVNQDNQSAIHLAKCSGIKNRTKHIDVSYHFIKDLVRDKSVYLKYCPSAEMTADALTKPLGNILFLKHRAAMGLGNIFCNNSDSVAHNQSD